MIGRFFFITLPTPGANATRYSRPLRSIDCPAERYLDCQLRSA
jgi:hypothetical protein